MTEGDRLFVMSLGTPRLVDASGVTLPCARKELALLAYLLCRPLQQATRDTLAEVFWGGRGEERAKHSLRQSLHRLRPLLGAALEASADRVRVADGAVTLDVTLFERAIADGDLASAVAQWEGDFLQGYEDAGAESYRVWLEAEREALRRRLELAFARLSSSAANADPAAESALADRWLAMLPHSEAAHERRLHVARRAEQRSGPTPSSAALLTPDYIGGQVLDALRQCWADAEQRAVVAVVYGGDGLGKSRVCAELVRGVARGDASTVVLEACARDEDRSRQPNETARRLFEGIGHTVGVADAPSRAVAIIAHLVPALRDRFPQVAPPPAGASLADALVSVLRVVAARRRVLIVLDDAHRADDASQRLIAAISKRLPDGVLMVFTAPAGERSGPLLGELPQMPAVRALRLAPLSSAEVDALVGSMLMLRPSDRAALSRRLFSEAGGNPFFTVELVAALADSGHLAIGGDGYWRPPSPEDEGAHALPSDIVEAIRARLARLGGDDRRVLDAAAVLGQGIDTAGLSEATGLGVARVQNALDVLVARRLMRPAADRPDRYELSHALIRRAVSELIPASARPSNAPTNVRARRWTRSVRAGVAAAVVLISTTGLFASWASEPEDPSTTPLRVVVIPLTNTTGDPGAQPLGRITADWLTQVIAQSAMVHVVPFNLLGRGIVESAGGRAPDVQKVAASANVDIAVWGSLERAGDSLRLRAWITDVERGEILGAVTPVMALSAEPMAAVKLLGDRTLAALAHHVDPRLAATATRQSAPPTYEAYRSFAAGLEMLIARRGKESLLHFGRAYAADTSYTLPLLYAAITYDGLGDIAAVDSLARRLTARRGELAPFDRRLVDVLAARSRGDWAAVLTATQGALEIAPTSLLVTAYRASAALYLNRPREATRSLATVDESAAHDFGLSRFWALSASAAHQTADYERQLAIGRTVRQRLPNDERHLFYEGRALAALRRYTELDAVLTESVARPRVPQWGAPGLWLHLTIADELTAHGESGRATSVLARALALYYDSRAASLPEPADSLDIARVLYRIGRYAEARQIIERLVDEHPDGWLGVPPTFLRAHLGFVAAAAGDRQTAEAVDRWLAGGSDPYHFGTRSMYRAELAAMLGERARAVRLLQQAAAEGNGFDQNVHVIHELQRLRGYTPFEEWLRPKG